MKSIAAKLLGMVPWSKAKPVQPAPAGPLPLPDAPVMKGTQDQPHKLEEIQIVGSTPGWLRVQPAHELLAMVRAERAITQIWNQSHQSQAIWERDLLPAIIRYAEFVQLMPASEAHHHAHAGGLLSHTIEMLLAAMTWRNAHLLPGGSQIETIDEQRDQWSYVVFFAALLHDIAKPMTDLRIDWRPQGLSDPIRWTPAGGSLVQIAGQRPAEYLVDFAPKSQRDYSAHAKLAQLLLPRIAPESALRFLAHTPAALDALEKYLSGQDKDSLVAKIVRRADQLSTQRALKNGSKARFGTAKAVPLIDLLMQSMTSILQAGTQLPLNRNGAAGWVFEGAVWFVAKRLADTVREHIQAHEPEESIPGAAKNDRLFDTWQDYGVIELNPATGQAIWHITVHGYAEDGAEQGAYIHDFAVLKFPLAKLYPNESRYPAAMRGRLDIRDKRKSAEAGQEGAQNASTVELQNPAAISSSPETAAAPDSNAPSNAAAGGQVPQAAAKPKRQEDSAQAKKQALIMRDPTAGRPAMAATPKTKPAATTVATKPEAVPTCGSSHPEPRAAHEPFDDAAASRPSLPTPLKLNYDIIDQGDAAYLLDALDDGFLDPTESAAAARSRDKKQQGKGAHRPALQLVDLVARGAAPGREQSQAEASPSPASAPAPKPPPAPAQPSQTAAAEASRPPAPEATPVAAPEHFKPAAPKAPPVPHDKLPRSQSVSADFRRMADELDELPTFVGRTVASRESVPPAPAAAPVSQPAAGPGPVLLLQQLPEIQSDDNKPPPEPSALAMAFMRWVQMSMVQRELKFNETGAVVHFVEEGMALVSPKIFKEYARHADREPGHEDLPVDELATKAQRELIKCGWHLPAANRTNIVSYEIHSRGSVVGKLSCVVLTNPGQWVQPIPPSNPALKMV